MLGFEGIKIFGGRTSFPFAEKVCKELGMEIGKIEWKVFPDGEVKMRFEENVRGFDVFLIQSTHSPLDNIFDLLLMMHTAYRASAGRVTAVFPYWGYGRQDRKDKSRSPITGKLMADLVLAAAAGEKPRVLSVDFHSGQTQGFFNTPYVDELYARPAFLNYIRSLWGDRDLAGLIMVAPDHGAAKRTKSHANRMGCDMAVVDKNRPKDSEVEIVSFSGNVEGKTVVIIDDMIDTAGTICQAAREVIKKGAVDVWGIGVHALLSGPAVERIEASPISRLIFSDTIPIPPQKMISKIKVISVAPLIAEAIGAIHGVEGKKSISKLFD